MFDDESVEKERHPIVRWDTAGMTAKLKQVVDAEVIGLLDELQCSICKSIFRNAICIKKCLHRFCRSCFDRWIRHGAKDCPTCRVPLGCRRDAGTDDVFERAAAVVRTEAMADDRVEDDLRAVMRYIRVQRPVLAEASSSCSSSKVSEAAQSARSLFATQWGIWARAGDPSEMEESTPGKKARTRQSEKKRVAEGLPTPPSRQRRRAAPADGIPSTSEESGSPPTTGTPPEPTADSPPPEQASSDARIPHPPDVDQGQPPPDVDRGQPPATPAGGEHEPGDSKPSQEAAPSSGQRDWFGMLKPGPVPLAPAPAPSGGARKIPPTIYKLHVRFIADPSDPSLRCKWRLTAADDPEEVKCDLGLDVLGLVLAAGLCLPKPLYFFYSGGSAPPDASELLIPLDPHQSLQEAVEMLAALANLSQFPGLCRSSPLYLVYRRSMFPPLPPGTGGRVYVPPLVKASRLLEKTKVAVYLANEIVSERSRLETI